MLLRMVTSRFSPMKVLSDAEYEAMLKEKLIRVDAELAVLDEDLAKLRQEVVDKGTNPVLAGSAAKRNP